MTVAEKLFELFRGNEEARGVFNAGTEQQGVKVSGISRVIKGEAPTVALWEEHLAGESGLGVIPIKGNNNCNWAAIDVDKYNIKHVDLVKDLRKRGIDGVVGRSKSGGAHLYFFFQEEIDAIDVRAKLAEIASAMGFASSERFPKQTRLLADRGDTGSFLNMPYFAGERTLRYAYDDKAESLTVDEFVDYAFTKRYTRAAFLELKVTKQVINTPKGPFPEGPPCLQHLAAQGFGEGSRNNALFNLCVYARQAKPDTWETEIIKYNSEHLNPPLSQEEVNTLIKQFKKKDYYYKCGDQPIKDYCNKTLCMTRKFGVGQSGQEDIGGIVQIKGDPPIWFLSIDGNRVELENHELHNLRLFQRKCLATIGYFPRFPSENVWHVKLLALLEKRSVVEATDDTTFDGQFSDQLRIFGTDRGRAYSLDDAITSELPFRNDGYIWFTLVALDKHLQQVAFPWRRTKIRHRCLELGAVTTSHHYRGVPSEIIGVPDSFFGDMSERPTPSLNLPKRELPF